MKTEEKQLLLKDLCSRLPYRVKVHIIDETGAEIDDELTTSTISHLDRWIVKPYLRPISSMTKKEDEDICHILRDEFYADVDGALCAKDDRYRTRLDLIESYIDWLNSHHFDYRGLIEKGLALKAPKDMYEEE